MNRHGFAYAEGGDEVVVLLPNTSIALAAAFAEELRREIEARSFATEDAPERITVSIGIASAVANLQPLPDWANLAKREAKERGRNQAVATLDGVAFFPVRPLLTFV